MPHGETHPTVLLIDDDPETGDLLGARLEESGFFVCTARGKADRAALARAVRPHVILLEFGARTRSTRSRSAGVSGIRRGSCWHRCWRSTPGARTRRRARGEAVEVARGEYAV